MPKLKILFLLMVFMPAMLWAQNLKTITGHVIDKKNNDPLIGVSVTKKSDGTTVGVTDIDGKFSVKASPGTTLVFTYVGYTPKEVVVNNLTTIDVALSDDLKELNEVVVVGYGSQKKVNLTGSVSQVKMDDIAADRPVNSIAEALVGNVPGLVLTGNSGEPGSGYNFQIRGTSSINGGSPLVLVDGISMDISAINPNDIESVSVLKDASASAIYGARAAFGVILITTKKSEHGRKPTVTLSTKLSMSNPQELPTRATPYETIVALKSRGDKVFQGGQDYDTWIDLLDKYKADPSAYPDGYAEVDGFPYFLKQTDATKDMLTTGFQQIYDMAVCGGGEKVKYRFSAGYLDQNGILITNKDYFRRYNISSFVSADITNWLTTNLSVLYTHSNKTDPDASGNNGRDIWAQTIFQPSFAPTDGTTINGTYYEYYTPANFLRRIVPAKNRYDRTNMMGRVLIKPFKQLTITGEYSINKTFYTNKTYNKKLDDFADTRDNTLVPSNTPYSVYRLQKADTDYDALNLFGTYKNKWGEHDFTFVGGTNFERSEYELLSTSRNEMINDNLPSLSQATGLITTNDSYVDSAIWGWFYRANYSFMDRYLLEASGRYDGSSKFPKGHRWGFFPSFSAGWRINQEAFLRNVKWISNLKIRASWGSIGNQNIAEYSYLPTMNSTRAMWGINGERPITLTTPVLVRSNFTWEKVRTTNFGLDGGLFDDRLSGSFDIFRRETLDMLGPGADYPAVLGAAAPLQNAANMRTDGWELQMNWRDVVGEVAYSIGFNLSDAQSKIMKYNNPTKSLDMPYYEGMKLGEIWGYVSDRLYTVDDIVEGTLKTTGAGELTGGTLKPGIPYFEGAAPNPGDMMYKNADADGKVWKSLNTVDDPGSRRIIGNSTPRYTFGINGSVSWKGWNLTFLFSGVGKRDLWMWNSYSAPLPSANDYALYTDLLNYWRADNQNAFYPRLYSKNGYNTSANTQVQTRYLLNGAYIDLKSLVLSYSLPHQLLAKCGIGAASVFIGGENLFSINHMPDGLHPDSQIRGYAEGVGEGGSIYPVMRKFTLGINLTF